MQDNDGVPVELTPGWSAFERTGSDGASIEAALQVDDVIDQVLAVYSWDEPTGTWRAFFPGLELFPGLNTLGVLQDGETYWVAAAEAVTWRVPGTPQPAPAVTASAGP